MSKNEFVIDTISDDDNDLEDLRALKKVKDEISKKKRALKDKDYLNRHPDLEELVQKHRRKKIAVKQPKPETTETPTEEPKKVELEVTETPAKLSWKDTKKKRKPKSKPTTEGIDYDKLAERIADKMKPKPKPKPDNDDDILDFKPKPVESKKKGEAEFNKKLDAIPEKVIEKPKTVIAQGGKWF
jgi:hypothetical protein